MAEKCEPIYHMDEGKRWVLCGIKSRRLAVAVNRWDVTCRRCLQTAEMRARDKASCRRSPRQRGRIAP